MKNPESELISLTLTNILQTDSEVDLFSFSSGGTTTNNTTTYYKINFTFVSGVQYQFLSTIGGVFNNYFTAPSILTIDDLILDFNSGGLATYGFFSYEVNGSAPNYTFIIKILDSTFIPTTFRSLTPTVSYPSGNPYTTILNSTVTISTGTSISYGELMSELQNQPYIINSVNVYADTQEQAMQRLKKTKKTASGLVYVDFERPRVDPMQSQFAIEHIDTKFTPSALNSLNYNMRGLESVRMWFYYDRIDISEINQKEFNQIIEPKTIIKMIKIRESINPLFDLVGTFKEKKVSIKEKLAPTIENRDVTDEEVYNSFDGLDFKEIE
jgi:hypothetical protein